MMVCRSCRCHTVETTYVFSLSMETKQKSRRRAWESYTYLFILPTQRLLPALVFCSPWLASPPGIFGHRLFLERAIFPPSGECEILGCVSDKARRGLSAGGREMNDQIARKLPFCVCALQCVEAHIVSEGRSEERKEVGIKTHCMKLCTQPLQRNIWKCDFTGVRRPEEEKQHFNHASQTLWTSSHWSESASHLSLSFHLLPKLLSDSEAVTLMESQMKPKSHPFPPSINL